MRGREGDENMRKPRIKNDGEGFYHVTSRCVDRTFRFAPEDKTRMADQIHRMGAFCGVEIGTYTVMSNHFHILLHVLPPKELSDEEICRRVAALYGSEKAEDLRQTWDLWRKSGTSACLTQLQAERNAFIKRMSDLSNYMKELKQWMSRSYNKLHNRKGTLWEDRFWSCLLEDKSETLTAIASYIDLNAVRAGIVNSPENYRWCGYAEAHAGHKTAQKTLASLFRPEEEMNWVETKARYEWLLRPVSGTTTERIPAFTRALALGSREFILETYARFPRAFTSRKRQAEPFVTFSNDHTGELFASHRPRTAAIG